MKFCLHPKKSMKKWCCGFAGIAAMVMVIVCESGISNQDAEYPIALAACNFRQCAEVAPTREFSGAYSWSSPADYSTKCLAIDETSMSGMENLSGFGASVKFISSFNKADCEATEITTHFYTKTPNSPRDDA